MSQNLDSHVLLRRSQIEEISINKMITNYKNIKPSLACVFVQNGNSCRDVVIQEISIKPMNTNYKIEIFYSPSEHKTYSGELPCGIKGEFGPGIRSLVITLNQNCAGAPRCKQRGMSAPALSFTVFLIKVDYFHLLICLLFFLVSLILNIICDNIGSCSIPYCSNISSITPKFPTPKLFSNFRIFFENFPCCYAFYNLHNS